MKNILRFISIMLVLVTLVCQVSCTGVKNDTEKSTTTTKKSEEEKPLPEFVYDPAVPKAKVQATSYYQISEPSAFCDKLTLATLQGIVANLCEDQILISGGAIKNYNPYLKKERNCKAETRVDSKSINLENLMAHYKDKLAGYILCDSSSSSDSGNVAVSLAGLLSAVVVTSDNQ